MIWVTPDRPNKKIINPTRALVHSPISQTIFFLGCHIPLAYILRFNDWVGTVHAVFIFLYGLNAALQKKTDKVFFSLGYIAGAEVLWRMTSANIPWEFAKYSSTFIVAVALMMEGQRISRGKERPSKTSWLFIYFALLLPAIIIPLSTSSIFQIRTGLSFNLSGALALAIIGFYFWNRSLGIKDLVSILLAFIGPVCGIWFLALYSTLTSEIIFILESNVVTSGGYGPNQVSNILGLGALACLILFIILEKMQGFKLILFLFMIAFITQSLLTFSRGGFYSFLIAVVIFASHIIRTSFFRRRFFAFILIAGLMGLVFIVPRLDDFTDGLWWERVSSLESTGRLELAQADWRAFLENPISGLGVDGSSRYHQLVLGDPRAAHTEYTRMLAEHGIFGVLALIVLFAMVWNRYWRNDRGINRAIVATFSIWSLTVMGQSAMRFVAISFFLSIAFALWKIENREESIE